MSEIIKSKDSDDHSKECVQNKYGNTWDLIGIEVRYAFSSSTPTMIKCAEGIDHYGNRIKKIDKSNTTSVFPSCSVD